MLSDDEAGYGMFPIQYNRMDVIKVKGLRSSKSTSHSDEVKVVVLRPDRGSSLLLFGMRFKGIAFLGETFGLGSLMMPF